MSLTALHSPRRRLPALLLACVVVLGAVYAGAQLPDPLAQNPPRRLLPPSAVALLGTDHLGRDVASRLLHGGLLTLGIAVAGVVLPACRGLATGLVGGYQAGRAAGLILQGIAQVKLSFPSLWLPLIVLALAGRTWRALLVAIVVSFWVDFFWVIQREVRRLCAEPFVDAARALGYSHLRILTVELLPHLASTIVWLMLLYFRGAVMLVSTLSFLGLGPPPPTPTWGLMIAEARPYFLQAWWVIAVPAAALALSILAAAAATRLLGSRLSRQMSS